MNNRKKSVVLTSLGILFLVGIPTLSQADYCADIKEKYWKCARSVMTGEKCNASDNVTIPPECLTAGSESQRNESSSTSSTPSSSSSFFGSKKDSTPFIYPKPDLVPKKPVKIINIKPLNGKIYLETEEEVEQFTTKIREDLLNAIKEGKRVRLQFN